MRFAQLLPLVFLWGCGLDDFDWGSGVSTQCRPTWRMWVASSAEAEPIPFEVVQMDREETCNLRWKARLAGVRLDLAMVECELPRQQIPVPFSETDELAWVSGPCQLFTRETDLREEPLERYDCELRGELGPEQPVEALLRLEEAVDCF